MVMANTSLRVCFEGEHHLKASYSRPNLVEITDLFRSRHSFSLMTWILGFVGIQVAGTSAETPSLAKYCHEQA